MKTKILLLLLLLPLIGFSQNNLRQLLRGHIIADSISVGDVVIKNLSSKINAVSDANGDFTMYAKAGDTLLFNSITYHSERLVLKQSHLLEDPLTLKMEINVTTLSELIITPLTGDLGYDAKKKKIKALNPDLPAMDLKPKYPKEKVNVNAALPSQVSGSQLTGVDFVAISKMIFKKKKKKTDRGEVYGVANTETFTDVTKKRFTYYFFTETLKIPNDEIGAFLVFSDKGAENRTLLDPRREFELTDYLISQAKLYLEQKK